jgi:serine/threonine protein kinase
VSRDFEFPHPSFPDAGDAARLRDPASVKARLPRRSLDMMAGLVVAQRYRIGGALGVGGMGFVYEAEDLQTGMAVALKALPPGAPDPIRLRRLRREAAVGQAVRSDHVCRVHYLGVHAGTPFIVMERLHGHTLRNQLDNSGPVSFEEAAAIVFQLLDALTATHEMGVIHRDVKPSNVFLTPVALGIPRVKLIDFGLAKIVGNGELNNLGRVDDITSSECVVGTLQYVPPEALNGIGELDERGDVYAAGIILFEALTGERAYSGSYADIVHDIVLGDVPRVTNYRPNLPPTLDDVLRMAMAKARDRRFASARAFKRALLAVLEQHIQKQSGVCPSMEGQGYGHANEQPRLSAHDIPTVRPPGYAPHDMRDTAEDLPNGGFDDEPTKRYSSASPLPLPGRVPGGLMTDGMKTIPPPNVKSPSGLREAVKSSRSRRTGG